MHKQYLWVDRRGAELRWGALGNANIGASGKGSLVYWVRKPFGNNRWYDDFMWGIVCDDSNMVRSRYGRGIGVRRDGVWSAGGQTDINWANSGAWELHMMQWDFTQGKLWSYYNDGVASAPERTGVAAPNGTAQYIQIGYPYSSPTVYKDSDLRWHGLAIWDDLLTVPQMQAIYARGYQDELQAGDGTGNLIFLLRMNEGLTAEVAGGSPLCTPGATSGPRWCLMEEGTRNLGTAVYPLGTPRHDGSEDDRKPLAAVCRVSLDIAQQQAAVSDLNESTYSRLQVQGYTYSHVAGAFFPEPPSPGTYRQLIHVPDEGNTAGYEMGIGPLAYKHYPSTSTGVFDQYGSGRNFSVVADAGNSQTAFKTNLTTPFAASYWIGAWVHLYSGNCRGYRGKVVDFNGTTKVITLDTTLPEIPAAESVGFINFCPRVIGQNASGGMLYDYTVEANLWSRHDSSKHFTMLEWQASPNAGFLRYDRGRTAVIPGSAYNGGGRNVMYGKGYGYTDSPSTNLEIWLRKIELAGPQKYQLIGRQAQRQGATLADNFLVRTRDSHAVGGDSVKLWRKTGTSLVRERPVKQTDYQAVWADLTATGTWRATVDCPPMPLAYDEATQVVTCAITGKDAAGVRRLGYIQGHWDEQTGRIGWTEEPAPVGKANPVIDMSTLRTDRESDAPYQEPQSLCNVLQAPDGTWSLLYNARPDAVDGAQIWCLHGAEDRWSFDFAEQFAGPLVPMFGGVDTREPLNGNGFVPWVNMHAYWTVWENPYATSPQRRYQAYVGGKTIFNSGTGYSVDMRPVIGCQGADLRSLRPLPHGNALTPLPGANMHMFTGTMLGQEDAIGLLFSDGVTSGVGLMTSEDGVHFQSLYVQSGVGEPLLPYSELPGESFCLKPGPAFRLGDLRVYYYGWDEYASLNFATVRWNGETSYQMDAEQTETWLETAILERPESGWGELYVNAAPEQGTVQVELRDPVTETAVTGWARGDCSAIGDSVRGQVTWGGAGLGEQTAQYLRLRFYLSRASATDTTPKLYAWETAPLVILAPQVTSLQVEGQVAPAGVGDTQPTLSWSYSDPQSLVQTAWQVQVAATREALETGQAEMWDTGVRIGAETSVVYAGEALGDYETYFWRVRVRNEKGVWSEEW